MANLLPLDTVSEIDLVLAALLTDGGESPEREFERRCSEPFLCIAGALGFLGIAASYEDVESTLRGRPARFVPGSAERGLIEGLHGALELVRARASSGATPNGEFLLALWKRLTACLPGSHPAATRLSEPRDAQSWLGYPPAASLPSLLARFSEEHCFLDFPALFQTIHPVRQCFRIFHRLARIAPFHEHNVIVAWLAASEFLLARGYPQLLLADSDEAPVRQLLSAGPPRQFPLWEERLLAAARRLASASPDPDDQSRRRRGSA